MALDPHPVAFFIATLLSVRSLRKGSLTRSGSLAAFIVGYSTLANRSPIYGVCLIVFFLAGSQSTKYKQSVKAGLVRENELSAKGPTAASASVQETIARDWRQVLCNSLLGTSCALTSRICASRAGSDAIPPACGLGEKAFLWGAVSYWSACAGDTVSSLLRSCAEGSLTEICASSLRAR